MVGALVALSGIALVPGTASASTATLAEAAGHLRIIVPSPALSQGHIVPIGDWNGDGIPDVAVSQDTGGPGAEGEVWIVYGQSAPTTIDLSGGTLPAGAGVTIQGSAAASLFGVSLAAGDVNGDGRPDLVIGAPTFLTSSVVSAVWVIFAGVGTGTTALTSGTLDLGLGAGTHGYSIAGPAAHGDLDQFGIAVAVVHDMNGDGKAEIAIGAPAFTTSGRTADGAAYVAFGKSTTAQEQAANLSVNDQGFAVIGAAAHDAVGSAVDGGDFNGDGHGDLLVGGQLANGGTGAAYVIFGKSGTANVDLAGAATSFLAIDGATSGDHTGEAVAVVPDMNGDGRAEAVVCSPYAVINGLVGTGECSVVFGRAAAGTTSLASLGTGGFAITGALAGGIFGTSVASAGDMNGDGRGDIVIGGDNELAAPDGSAPLSAAGLAVVVLGQPDPLPLAIDNLGVHGYAIAGTSLNQLAGAQVIGAGDLDGDGRSDLLIESDGVGGRFFDAYTARPLPTAGAVSAPASTTTTMRISVPVSVLGGAPTALSLQLTPSGGPAINVPLANVTASGTFTATLTGLVPDTSYTLQVGVSNVFGATTGPASSAVTEVVAAMPTTPTPIDGSASDRTPPRATIAKPACPHLKKAACTSRRSSRLAWRTLHGADVDPGSGASGVKKVSISLLHVLGKGRCVAFQSGKLHTTTCAKARLLTTPATLEGGRWSLRIAPRLPLGSWTLTARAVDGRGNSEPAPAATSFRLTH